MHRILYKTDTIKTKVLKDHESMCWSNVRFVFCRNNRGPYSPRYSLYSSHISEQNTVCAWYISFIEKQLKLWLSFTPQNEKGRALYLRWKFAISKIKLELYAKKKNALIYRSIWVRFCYSFTTIIWKIELFKFRNTNFFFRAFRIRWSPCPVSRAFYSPLIKWPKHPCLPQYRSKIALCVQLATLMCIIYVYKLIWCFAGTFWKYNLLIVDNSKAQCNK